MGIIYVVTRGAYSDYSIVGVTTDRKKAEDFVNNYNKYREEDDNDAATLEEYPDGEGLELTNVWCTRVTMTKIGEVRRLDYDLVEPEYMGFCYFGGCGEDAINWNEPTINKMQAVKAVNEKRAIILANNIWGDTEKVKEMFGPRVEKK